MDATVLLVFALVYLGMISGGAPGLALDRTGVALLASGSVTVSTLGVAAAWLCAVAAWRGAA